MQKKDLGDKVSLQDAFDLVKDMHGQVERPINQKENYVEQKPRTDLGGWDRRPPPPVAHSVAISCHSWWC